MTQTLMKDQHNYLEYSDAIVDYNDGDVVFYDQISNLSQLPELTPKTNIVALCSRGSMTMKIDGKIIRIEANEALVCPPNGEIEACEYSHDFLCKVFCFQEHVIQALLRDKIETWNQLVYINKVQKLVLTDVCKQEIDLYYSLICSKLQNAHRFSIFQIMQALMRALLLELCLALEEVNGFIVEQKMSQGKVLFNKFLTLVSNSDVKRQPIADYASQLAITPKYLTMLCLKYSGKTASDWVIQYTTEDIRYYLRNSNLSIKEVSAKLGFTNMSHFGSYVRKHIGMSPSDFRHRK